MATKPSVFFLLVGIAAAVTNGPTTAPAAVGSRTCALLCHTEVASSFCSCAETNPRNVTLVCSSLCSMGIPSKRCRCELPSNLCFVYCSLNAEVGIATANCNCQQLLSVTEKPPPVLPMPSTQQQRGVSKSTITPETPKAKDLCQVLCKANLGANLCDCQKRKRSVVDDSTKNMADMNYIHHDICHVLCKKGLGFDICDECINFNITRPPNKNVAPAATMQLNSYKDDETRDSMCEALCAHNEGGTLCDCDGHLVKKRETSAFFAFHCALSCKHLSKREKQRCGCVTEDFAHKTTNEDAKTL